MGHAKISHITWESSGERQLPLVVERIKPGYYRSHAAGILSVMAAAYADQFGPGGTESLEAGAAYQKFDANSEARVLTQYKRMWRYRREERAEYWAAYGSLDFHPGKDMIGVAKTTPSRPGFRRYFGKPNCYVGDLESAIPGTDVRYALLTAGLSDFDESRVAAVDAIKGTEGFYEGLGFVAKPEIDVGSIDVAGTELDLTRYEAVAIGGVMAVLNAEHQWLIQGVPTFMQNT